MGSIADFYTRVIDAKYPRQPNADDYRQLLASVMGNQQPGVAPESPVTNQMQDFGADMAAGYTPQPPGATEAPFITRMRAQGITPDMLKKLDPKSGTAFINSQLTQAASPEQEQLVRQLQMRKQIGDTLAKAQNAPPDFAPVNVSPQLVGEGITGTRTAPNMPSTPSMPVVPKGFEGFDYGGKVTQNAGLSPELLRSLAIKAYAGGGNPADVTALMNIGKGDNVTQFDPEKDVVDPQTGEVIRKGTPKAEPPKAPTTRTYDNGPNSVTEEYDPVTATWRNIAKAPRKLPGDADEANKPPAGYRWNAAGALEFIPGGPADPTKGAGRKAPTEDQAKNMQLYSMAVPQAKILLGDDNTLGMYDELASRANQIPRAVGAGINALTFGMAAGNENAFTGEHGQRAANAIEDLTSSYLYSVSGATANPGEVKVRADLLKPKLTDSKAALADKKARIKLMVDSIRLRASGVIPPGEADAPWTGMGLPGASGGASGSGWSVKRVQ